jgi:uncharacterized repeat protein (TIGR03803 family)
MIIRYFLFAVAALLTQQAHSQYTVIRNFGTIGDGISPTTGLTLSSGMLYGVTGVAGTFGYGTVFRLGTDGSDYTVLHNFDGSGAVYPGSTLTLSGTTLFGTAGGLDNGFMSVIDGGVFSLSIDGSNFSTLTRYPAGGPANPVAFDSNTLYGTTWRGGSGNLGTAFKIQADGSGYALLHEFDGPGSFFPNGMTLAGSSLYGTLAAGGVNDGGAIFRMGLDGTGYTVLKQFTGDDGRLPSATLTLVDTVLYGTTTLGGTFNHGTVFKVSTDGTGYTILKSFTGDDGDSPYGGLVLTGSTIYGTTQGGGSSDSGVLFQIATDGSDYTVLKEFAGVDGRYPLGDLLLADQVLYGTTRQGGSTGYGTAFSYTIVPEPCSAIALLLGGAPLLLRRPLRT